jgi:hypothetical protein
MRVKGTMGRGLDIDKESEWERGKEERAVTSWYPSTKKAVLIKLSHWHTFTWVIRTCLPVMDQVRRGLKEKAKINTRVKDRRQNKNETGIRCNARAIS